MKRRNHEASSCHSLRHGAILSTLFLWTMLLHGVEGNGSVSPLQPSFVHTSHPRLNDNTQSQPMQEERRRLRRLGRRRRGGADSPSPTDPAHSTHRRLGKGKGEGGGSGSSGSRASGGSSGSSGSGSSSSSGSSSGSGTGWVDGAYCGCLCLDDDVDSSSSSNSNSNGSSSSSSNGKGSNGKGGSGKGGYYNPGVDCDYEVHTSSGSSSSSTSSGNSGGGGNAEQNGNQNGSNENKNADQGGNEGNGDQAQGNDSENGNNGGAEDEQGNNSEAQSQDQQGNEAQVSGDCDVVVVVNSTTRTSYDPYTAFDIYQCNTYSHLWAYDLSISCEQGQENCHCTFAEELLYMGYLTCNDAYKCPVSCPVCSNCLRLVCGNDIPAGQVVYGDENSMVIPAAVLFITLLCGGCFIFNRRGNRKGTNLEECLVEVKPPEHWMVPVRDGVPAEGGTSCKPVWLAPQNGIPDRCDSGPKISSKPPLVGSLVTVNLSSELENSRQNSPIRTVDANAGHPLAFPDLLAVVNDQQRTKMKDATRRVSSSPHQGFRNHRQPPPAAANMSLTSSTHGTKISPPQDWLIPISADRDHDIDDDVTHASSTLSNTDNEDTFTEEESASLSSQSTLPVPITSLENKACTSMASSLTASCASSSSQSLGTNEGEI